MSFVTAYNELVEAVLIENLYYCHKLVTVKTFIFKCLALRPLWNYSSKKLQENTLYLICSLNQRHL